MSDTANKRTKCLMAKSLSFVQFLDINGSPVEQFDPKLFVFSWLKMQPTISYQLQPRKQAQTKPDRPLWYVLGGIVMH